MDKIFRTADVAAFARRWSVSWYGLMEIKPTATNAPVHGLGTAATPEQ